MKGKLFNNKGVWYVEHEAEKAGDNVWTNLIPLDPEDVHLVRHEPKTVEYEVITKYVEPNESIHCNRGADVEFARLIPDRDIEWNAIIDEYMKETNFGFPLRLRVWLKKNYCSPKKKEK